MEYYSAAKRYKLLISAMAWMDLKNYAKWEKLVTTDDILYDSTDMKHQWIYRQKADSDCLRWGGL